MKAWPWLLLVAGIIAYKMFVPIARAMLQERKRRAALPPAYTPKVRPPDAFDADNDDWPKR